MCPQCRAFITVDDRVCPYCDVKLGERAIDRRAPSDLLGGFISGARFTTVMILTANLGLYVACMLYSMQGGNEGALVDLDARTLFDFGAKYPAAIYAGQWWRLITAGFLHGGLWHILMNSWALFDLSANVEELIGPHRLIAIYFLSTVAGFGASTFWSNSLSVGASAAIFGLIGAMIAYGRSHRSGFGEAVKAQYMRWAIYGLLFGLLPFFPVDNAAHVGGLAAGFVVATLAGSPKLTEDHWQERLWRFIAYACLAMTAAAFVLMFFSFTSGKD